MKYGYFSDDAKEYCITRPDTPASWVNYLGTEQYCAIVSNNAAGYAFHRSPKTGRLLRFRFNSVPTDRPGRYFYLRDADDGDYWSVTWQPVAKPFIDSSDPSLGFSGPLDEGKNSKASYTCRHRPGVSVFEARYRNIFAEVTAFVPKGEAAEVWSLKLENRGSTARRLDLFGYVEWCFWHIQQDSMNFQYILYTCRMDQEDGIIDYSLRLWPLEEPKGFFASTGEIKSFDTDRDVFLGNYRHEGIPQAVENGSCANSRAIGGTPCGALQTSVELAPGEVKTISFICGVGDAKTVGVELRDRFSNPEAVQTAIADIDHDWNERLSAFSMHTPDPALNSMGNIWNQVQCHTTFNWSRSASFNEAGGRDGVGYRDTCQDALGVLHSVPERVREKIIWLLRAQYASGAAMHHFQPLEFHQGAHNHQALDFSDDHLWLLVTVPAYIRETGDFAILSETVSYADAGSASVWEHLLQAVEYSWAHRGPHGLCLGLAADWNDCLNLRGQGETVLSTFLLLKGLKELSQLGSRAEASACDPQELQLFEQRQSELEKAIAHSAWDGDYFLRGYVDSGKAIGSRSSEGSKIFLNAQSWAVLSGAADRERLLQAMNAVHRELATEHGAVLNAPSYEEYDAEVGAITTFPGGLKENGGIFCHSNTWPVIAETLLGRGDEAYELFRAFLPAAKNDSADLYGMEPYAFSQFITGQDHPSAFGRARNSWLTGTATWSFVALSQAILGIRADYDGLCIQPCTPSDWTGFEASRRFRGSQYEIIVRGNGRVVSASVDGVSQRIHEGGLRLPLAEPGSRLKVEVICESAVFSASAQ